MSQLKLVLHAHQALINSLYEFLYSELVNHTYDQSINYYPYQYHATLSLSTETGPHLGIPTMAWHCTYCQHIYLYAWTYNWLYDNLYNQIWQVNPFGNPVHPRCVNLINLLAPPFPPLPPPDLTNALCTLTWHETSPEPENETTMPPTNGQARLNDVNHYHANSHP